MNKTQSFFTRFLVITLICVGFCVFGLTTQAAQGINRQINYQGRLLTSGGNSVADGTYLLTLSLYNAGSGGTPLWTASGTTGAPTAMNVTITNGLFSIQLGDTAAGQNPFDFDFYQSDLYLGVTVASDTEMVPRKRLTAVPYAFVAETLQGQYASSAVANTGGALFTLQQTSTSAATADRTALFVRTSGTSNQFDYLIKANSGSDVFTVSRQGNVTTTGNFASNGNVILGDTTGDTITVNGRFVTDLNPATDDLYALGTPTLRWRGIDVVNVTSTNATTTNLTFTNASGSTLLIAGQSVCLANGTNCPASTASIQDLNWAYDAPTDLVRNNTSTSDIVIGGTATTTAPVFYKLDGDTASSNRLVLGQNQNLDVVIGASTSSISNAAFQLSGNDLFVAGNIGSASSVYTNASFIAGGGSTYYSDGSLNKTNGDFSFNLGAATTSWRFNTAGLERLTVASSGNVGIGLTSPEERLDVSGNIKNILHSGDILRQVATTTFNTGAGTAASYVAGNYAYVTNYDGDNLATIDVSNPFAPRQVATTTFRTNSSPGGIFVAGKYAYVTLTDYGGMAILDISNPALPLQISTTTFSTGFGAGIPIGIHVSGKYAYVTNFFYPSLLTFDVSNPFAPVQVATTTFTHDFATGGARPNGIDIQGRYAYIPNRNNATMATIDLLNPALPVQVATTTFTTGSDPWSVDVEGRYAYVSLFGTNQMSIVDISNALNPVQVATTTFNTGAQPGGLRVSGRYAHVGLFGGNAIATVDISNPLAPVQVATTTFASGSGTNSLFLSGRYLYVVNNTVAKLATLEIKGLETSSLLAGSAEVGSLSILTNGTIANQLIVGGGLLVGSGGISSNGALSVTASSTFVGAITVQGQLVCLASGTNCPASSGSIQDLNWAYDAPTDLVRNNTSTSDIVIGGTATTTAPVFFQLDGVAASSNRLVLGQNQNLDVVIGGATSTLSNGQFQLSGNDLFVAGNIGSVSSVYTNGSFVAGGGSTYYSDGSLSKTNGDFSFQLGAATTSWRFYTGGVERLTAASSGNIGIGLPNPTEALDVSGNIQDILHTGDVFERVATTTFNVGSGPFAVVVAGKYAYVVNNTANSLATIDLSNPAAPLQVATTTFGTDIYPTSVFVAGRYAYVALDTDAVESSVEDRMAILDISNPAVPVETGSLDLGGENRNPASVYVSGRYAYIANGGADSIFVVDISNPALPTLVASKSFAALSAPADIVVSGRYAYVANSGNDTMATLDISNPLAPIQVATTTFNVSAGPTSIFVSGRYAYVANQIGSNMATIDISNAASPVQVATTTFNAGTSPGTIFVSGRYAYVGGSSLQTINISNPRSPVQVATTTGSAVIDVFVSGRYAYVADGNRTLVTYDIRGAEVNGLIAHSAELGSLQVLTNGSIANQFTIGGGLTVGAGGILSTGPLSVTATSTFVSPITVQGQLVCLANGTNCPASSGSIQDLNWAYDAPTDLVRNNTSTSDIVIGGTATTTAPVFYKLDGVTASSNRLVLGQNQNMDVVIGAATSSGLNSMFQLSGNDLYVQGNIGSASSVYSNGAFIAGSGSTLYGDGFITKTNGNLSLSASGGFVTPSADLGLSLGSASLRFNGVFGNTTSTNSTSTSLGVTGISILNNTIFTNATGTSLALTGNLSAASTTFATFNFTSASGTNLNITNNLTVGGTQVCLSSGANCPAASSGSIQDLNFAYDAPTDLVRNNTSTSDIVIGGTATTSAPVFFQLDGVSASSNRLVLGQNQNMDVTIGAATASITNSAFQLSGNDLFVAGNIGSASSVYTNGAFIAGSGSTLYGDGFITKTNGDLTLSASGGFVTPSADLGLSLGSASLRFNGVFGNTTSTNSTSTSLGVTGLSILNNTIFTNATGTSLALTGNLSAASTTFATLNFTSASGTNLNITNNLTVGGTQVCLSSGANCPAASSGSIQDLNWAYDAPTDLVRNNTSTSDIVIGGTATTSAPVFFQLDGVAASSNRLVFGQNQNLDVVIGAATSSGLNSMFQLSGNDLYVQGNIGSASSVYSNGAFVAGSGSTFFGDGFITKTNGSLTVTSSANITFVPSGNVGVGTSTPAQKLTVVGNVANTLVQNQVFSEFASTTFPNFVNPAGFILDGRYAYVAQEGAGTPARLHVIDVSNPGAVSSVGSVLLGANTGNRTFFSIAQYQKYVFVSGGIDNNLYVVDVSNPSAPTSSATFALGTTFNTFAVSGHFLFAADSANTLRIYDITNPLVPVLIRSITEFPGVAGGILYVSGNYLVTGDANATDVRIYDITSPGNPAVLSTLTAPAGIRSLAIQGRYLYVGALLGWGIYDIANPRSPSASFTQTFTSERQGLSVQGRYMYMAHTNGYRVWDIASSTAPILLNTYTSFGDIAFDLVASGRYLYHTHQANGSFVVTDISGIETNGLVAASAEAGSLTVRTDAYVGARLSIGGSITVGAGGVTSLGALSVNSTNTTSTFAGFVSTTRMEVSNRLTVGGVSVCLASGANCPASSASIQDLTWTYDAPTDLVRNNTSTSDIVIGGTATTSAPVFFQLDGVAASSNRLVLGQNQNMNVVIGAATSSGLNSIFQLSGNDLYVQGNIGSASSVYSNGAFVAGNTWFGDGFISKTDGNLTLSASGGFVTPSADLGLSLGSASLRFNGVFGNTTSTNSTSTSLGVTGLSNIATVVFTNATGTSLALTGNLNAASTTFETINFTSASGTNLNITNNLTVSGAQVCLANGVNCPASGSGSIQDLNWAYDAPTDLVRNNTSTSDIVIGGTATTTAPVFFQLDGVTASSNRLVLGQNQNLDVVIGGSTSTLLNALFQLSGNDLFVAGNIGSVSSVYTNGAFVAGSGSTFFGDGFITKTNGSLFVTSSQNILLNASGIGVGTSTVSSLNKLTVVGNVANTLVQNQTFTDVASTTFPNLVDPAGLIVEGRYAYLGQQSSGTPLRFHVIDVSSPGTPSSVGSVLLAADSAANTTFFSMGILGKYVYVPSQTTNSVFVVDVSIPSAPTTTASFSATNAITALVNGAYLYVGTTSGILVYRLSNPLAPVLVRTLSASGTVKTVISGDYLFAAGSSGVIDIYDITNPENPALLSSTNAGVAVDSFAVQGRYMHIGLSNAYRIYDISNPRAPTQVASTAITEPRAMSVQGRYAYLSHTDGYRVYDIASSTAPILIQTVTGLGTFTRDLVVAGRYLYHTHLGSEGFIITDIGGIETNGLIAANAEFGSLQIHTNADILNRLSVGASLSVGVGGISSAGAISVYATNTTSTFAGTVSSTNNTVTDRLVVGGSAIFSASAGVGTSTVSSLNKLTVVGNVANTLVQNQTFTDVASTTFPNLVDPAGLIVEGRYAYLGQKANGTPLRLHVIDVSSPGTPSSVGSVLLTADSGSATIFSMGILGKYVYVPSQTTNVVFVVDVSNPSAPTTVATFSAASALTALVNGAYLYVGTGSSILVYRLTNPLAPVLVRTLSASGTVKTVISGDYLFAAGNSGVMDIYDITNPENPALMSSTNIGVAIDSLAVQGRHLHIGLSNAYRIYDISNPRAPTQVASTAITDPRAMSVQGRYAYLSHTDGYRVYDIASSTAPILIQTVTGLGTFTRDLVVAGRYLYHTHHATEALMITDISGVETNGLIAASAEFGSLQVRTDGFVADRFTIGGSLSLGLGGMISNGALAVYSTNTTSTFSYAVSSTRGEFTQALTVGGVHVCLSSGINCPASSASIQDLNFAYDAPTDLVRNNTSTSDIVIGGTATTSAPVFFQLDGVAASSNRLVLGSNQNLNVTLGSNTSSGLHPNFQLSGNDLFAVGNIGSATSIYAGGDAYISGTASASRLFVGDGTTAAPSIAFANAPGSGIYGSAGGNYIFNVNGSAQMGFFGTFIYAYQHFDPYFTNTVDLGAMNLGWRNVYVSSTAFLQNVSFTSATGSSLSLNEIIEPTSTAILDFASSTEGVAISGNYAYVGQAGQGLNIIDISNPTAPTSVRVFDTAGLALDVKVAGQYAYVADGSNGLSIIDVSNPQVPFLVGNVSTTGTTGSVYVEGRYAYVADGVALRVIDISNVTAPAIVGSAFVDGVSTVFVVGKYAYVGNNGGSSGVQIFDVSNPRSPIHVATAVGNGAVSKGPYVSGRYLYFADDNQDFRIFDISNPLIPTSAATFALPTAADGVVVQGRYAYLAASSFMLVIDVSSSTAPSIKSSYRNNAGGYRGIAVAGKYAYLTGSAGHFNVIDIRGADISSAHIGSLQTNSLYVLENIDIGNSAYIRSSLNVGIGGITSDGALAIHATNTTSTFAGVVSSTLLISGRALVSGSTVAAPGFSFSGSENTGIHGAVGTVSLITSGFTAFSCNSSLCSTVVSIQPSTNNSASLGTPAL
ncbi:MAG: hypothetical protein WC787_04615, partial [Patescibacteria group bacterium]